jgi:hypothetical protein
MESVGILIWDFQALELWEGNVFGFHKSKTICMLAELTDTIPRKACVLNPHLGSY